MTIHTGDSLAILRTLPDQAARCCVTSPPYWGLRDYGHDGQIGLEETPGQYVERIVSVFAEVWRVLADDGTLWLNLGDSYAATGKSGGGPQGERWKEYGHDVTGPRGGKWSPAPEGLKPKDLVGIPWRVAFALQDYGWYLRSDIIWHKPNPMPESVRDRCTKAHEYVFMLSKHKRYYWDQEAIREESQVNPNSGWAKTKTAKVWSYNNMPAITAKQTGGAAYSPSAGKGTHHLSPLGSGRNARSVWTIPTQPFPGAHFAVMPPALADRCIRAGSALGDTVLDPFAGAGTTGMVARRLQRDFIGIELNPTFAQMARDRIESDAPLFNRLVS